MDDLIAAILAFVLEFILTAAYMVLVVVAGVVVGVARLAWNGLRLAYSLIATRRMSGQELRRIEREEASAIHDILRVGAEAQAQLHRLAGQRAIGQGPK